MFDKRTYSVISEDVFYNFYKCENSKLIGMIMEKWNPDIIEVRGLL